MEGCNEPEKKYAPDEKVQISSYERKKKGRKKLPLSLPHIEVIHDIAEDEKICSCCGKKLTKIGEVASEEADIIPPTVQVIVHKRYKYTCKSCTDTEKKEIKIGAVPDKMIPKSMVL